MADDKPTEKPAGTDSTRLEKPALVVHLAGGGEPLLFALPPGDAEELYGKVASLLTDQAMATLRTRDGQAFSVNFAHVAVAYVDDQQRKGSVFGIH
ncbi:hypothetical protein SAMN05421810_107202 [Amycolatopsis arida]|uniref:DUF3107 domain-containing protein n=1 Tax=Amycolatopsis arida TaxID=587909 RepID=A0A1I5YJ49_9PSEU|nr:hypothetical protein [Amycolatopsis arida]TDX90555.1 hypothetical protein CLV69_107202 [Amycolatopsis arida]SFQ44253.1 hypothetical protein SAMN05421810_107202 [Amycolatopsis arida]